VQQLRAAGTAKARHITRAEAAHSRLRPRLDADASAMRPRRETAEHPFATIKARMDTLHAAHNGRGRNQSGARRPGLHSPK